MRTGLEAGLSAPISLNSLEAKSLSLDRPELELEPAFDIVRVSPATAIEFVLDLEEREAAAFPTKTKSLDLTHDLSLDPPPTARPIA